MGLGMNPAAAAAERILDRGDVDRLLVVGICGGLDESVPIGTVLCPAIVEDGATGEQYPSPEWAPITLDGRLVTFDDFALELKMIPSLVEQGASAVDMETAAVASVCTRRGVPYAVFRSISDHATTGVLDMELGTMVGPSGSPNIAKGLWYLVRHPRKIPALIALGKGAATATKAAANAAIAALRAS
jgi:adenosylhomocysteine nucleosidase